MRQLRRGLRLGAALVAVVAACSSPTEVEERTELGVLLAGGDPLEVTFPATVVSGAPFTVVVRTLAGGCSRKGPTETTIETDRVLVEPYDIFWDPVGDHGCPDYQALYRHSVEIEFQQKGQAILEVRGFNGVTGGVEVFTFELIVE